jgi:hypothetical protein
VLMMERIDAVTNIPYTEYIHYIVRSSRSTYRS